VPVVSLGTEPEEIEKSESLAGKPARGAGARVITLFNDLTDKLAIKHLC
jgi:hypothetical protein